MRRDYACHCCGLGLALSGFSRMQAIFNYWSFVVGESRQLDEDGWDVCSVRQFSPFPFFTQPLAIDLPRFAIRVDENDESMRIELDLADQEASVWQWRLSYRIPFADYDRLPAEGRLRLNEFLVSATHSGFTSATRSQFDYSLSGPTNVQAHLGDVTLVWPPFVLDWANKKLEAEIVAAQQTVVVSLGPNITEQVLDLTWAANPYEFVFDSTTLETFSNPHFERYVDVHDENFANDCFDDYRATHVAVLSQANNELLLGGDGLLRLSYQSGRKCNDPPVATQFAPAMGWNVTAIWWKAFAENDVVEVSDGNLNDLGPSPILFRSNFSQHLPLSQAQKQALPIQVTLTLTDIEGDE